MLLIWLLTFFGPTHASPSLVVTIDDLPMTGFQAPALGESELAWMKASTQTLLTVLKKHGVPAIGFINEKRLDVVGERAQRIELLENWLKAGMELGNHTYSHLSLAKTPVAEYEQDVLRGEQATRVLLKKHGLKPRFFRHPYTSTGATLADRERFEAFLSRHGYRVAPFTIDGSDYLFNSHYLHALAAGDQARAKEVIQAYVAHTQKVSVFAEGLAQDLFGQAIPQILLIHTNALNTDALDVLLTTYRERGYRFISLEKALTHKAYQTPDGYVGPLGLSWLHRWGLSLGRPTKTIRGRVFPATLLKEPDPPREWLKAPPREPQSLTPEQP